MEGLDIVLHTLFALPVASTINNARTAVLFFFRLFISLHKAHTTNVLASRLLNGHSCVPLGGCNCKCDIYNALFTLGITTGKLESSDSV